MVAPERKQKGDGVGEAESVEDLKIHSFHKQWDNYYVPNAKCVAEKPAPSTPAASYCLAGGLRTAAHGRTDGRTNIQAPAQDWPNHAAPEPGPTGLGPQTEISAGPALPPLGGPRPGPARFAVGAGTHGLRARPVSHRSNRGVSFPASQSHRERFKKRVSVLRFRSAPTPSDARAK